MDTQKFLKAWQQAPLDKDPYPHYLVKNLFDEGLMEELRDLPFEVPLNLDYQLGRREEFNSHRQYFNPEIINDHDCARRVADVFLSGEVISFIEKTGNVDLKDSLLRIEYTLDTNNFWLEPHTDIGVKNFTMLIYLSDDDEAVNWGTDIYADADTHFATVPSVPNTGLVFFPSEKTWHGFHKRNIKGVRKTLIVNYVTQEWRNRQELVHPEKTMGEFLKAAA